MAIREGKWDCTQCGQVGVRGPLTKCSKCGASRPNDVHFYLPSDAQPIVDPNLVQAAEAGPDYICSHCGSQNKATDNVCRSCGNVFAASEDQSLLERKAVPASQARTPMAKPRRKKKSIVGWLIILAILVFLIGGIVGLVKIYGASKYKAKLLQRQAARAAFIEKFKCAIDVTAVPVKLVKKTWSRTLFLQRIVPVTESGFNVPAGAQVVGREQRQDGYRKVQDGYTSTYKTKRVRSGSERYRCGSQSLGNGNFRDKYCTRTKYTTKQVEVRKPKYVSKPKYKTYYRYVIDRWGTVKTKKASGGIDTPRWPKLNAQPPRERIVRSQLYSLFYSGGDKAAKVDVSLERFISKKIGSSAEYLYNACGDQLGLDKL